MNSSLGIDKKSPFQPNDEPSTSNQTETPNCEDDERSSSPVLSNTKKSFMRMAKYRSRKKLLGKSSQDSVASSSFTDTDSLVPLSPILLDSQVSEDFNNTSKISEQNVDNDIKARFKRIKELQQQKKFRYDIVAKSSVNKSAIEKSNDSTKISENCDNNSNALIRVGFNTVSGKKLFITERKMRKYTDLLNEVLIEENDPMLQDLQDIQTNEIKTCSIVSPKQKIESNNNNNSKKSDVPQTQISDTQMIQAVENAESILELVDNKWTPDQPSSSKETFENFNVSSINFDSQWGVSPTKTQSTSLQQISTAEENPENLNITYLENVDTQWFFSPENKKTKTFSETSSEIVFSQGETVSVVSSQDFTLHVTEDEDNASVVSSSSTKRENPEMKTFFGVLSFSTDGSISLRQCIESESNMQLPVKSNSWIFDVSCDEEDTLGFNANYWKHYSKKFNSYVESFERHMFPEKNAAIEAKPSSQKQSKKSKKTKSKYNKKQKPVAAQNRNMHDYNLRETKNKQNEDKIIFKVPKGIPIRTTPKSSNTSNDNVELTTLETSNIPNNECATTNQIKEILQIESETNYYIPKPSSNSETTETSANCNKSLVVSIQLKNIQDFAPISKAITKKNNDFLEKIKELESDVTNDHMKHQLDELKQQMNLKFEQQKEYIKNAGKQNEIQTKTDFAFTTASGKKSEVSKKSLETIRNNTVISEVDAGKQNKIQSKTEFAFTTASGKKSKVSKESLETIRNNTVVSEVDAGKQNEIQTKTDFAFTTASGKKSKVSKESLETIRNNPVVSEVDTGKQNKTQSKTEFAFTTASGKKSEVSKKSLEIIRNNTTVSEVDAGNQKEIQLKSEFAFTTASGKKSEVSKRSLEIIRNENVPESSDMNNVSLDASDFNSPIEGEFDKTFICTQQSDSIVPSMNEEDFIENVDKILDLIEEKSCPVIENFVTTNLDLPKCSVDLPEEHSKVDDITVLEQSNLKGNNIFVNEEKLMEVELSSPIQKEFMDEFNTTSDFVTETVIDSTTIQQPEKSLEESNSKNTCSVSNEEETVLMEKLHLNYIDKNFEDKPIGCTTASIDSEKIPKRKRSIFENYDFKTNQTVEVESNLKTVEPKEIIPQLEINENSGFCFVSGKKPATKHTNIFNDILGNGPTPSISRKEKQLLDELKNISEDPNVESTGNQSASNNSTNMSSIDLESEPKCSLSEKEKQIKNELDKTSEGHVEEILPLIKLNEDAGLSFVHGNKIFNDSSMSKKKKHLLKEVEKIANSSDEEVLPLIQLTESTGFKFVTKSGNETKIAKSQKKVRFLEEVKSMSESSSEEVLPLNELNPNTGFNFVTNTFATDSYSKSKTEGQFLENIATEDFAEELLPQIEALDQNSGFCFVSGKKPSIKPTNIFNDLLGKEPKTSVSEKENVFCKELTNISSEEQLPRLEDNPTFTFLSGKRPITKPTNIFKDIFETETTASKSKKEEQFLEELKNISEVSIDKQLLQTEDSPGFSFVSGKKPATKSATNIFKNIFENETNAPKSKKEEQFLEGLKNISQSSAEDQLSPVKISNNPGFSFVSGKKPATKTTTNIFKDIFENETNATRSKKEEQFLEGLRNISEISIDEQLLQVEDNPGFSFVSGKKPTAKPTTNIFEDIFENEATTCKSKKEEQILEELKNISESSTCQQLPQVAIANNPGFGFVSGKKPTINPTTHIFKDIFEDEANAAKSKKEEEFLEELKNMSQGSTEDQLPQIEITNNPGFSFVSGKKPIFKPTDIFKDLFETEAKCTKSTKEKELLEAITNEEISVQKDKPEENNNKNALYSSPIMGMKRPINSPQISANSSSPIVGMKRPFDSPQVAENSPSPIVGMKRPFNSPQIAANSSTPISKRIKLGPPSRKRSLGSVAKSCRQLNLSESSAKKAKLIFEDFDVQPQDNINNNNLIPSTSKHTTPITEVENGGNTSLLNTSISMKETNETLINSQKNRTTPTKSNTSLEKHIPTLYSFHAYETDNIRQKSQLEKKYELLKLEMAVFQTRLQMIEQQEALIKHSNPDHRKQRTGCLLCQKSKSTEKLALKELGKLQKTSFAKALKAGVDKSLLEVTPKNALNFEFFVPWWANDNRTYPAIIHTEDGAVLIPNERNFIGVHEIEQAFLAMAGVDPKLVPENWTQNHYKWIVWKLASYERNFPAKFNGITSVDNVVAQLKYRYDREIDLAQRSALRRILELDDSPAKRMVLCVLNIFKSQSRQNELELTDGWYSIKTLVDPVLNNLINTNKIHVGLKLMIHGAELLNCEGCPPLETPANVRLQIHFNSTRRAAWHCKLGYQQNPGPLCVNLHTARNEGGLVGLTTVYIARGYPVSFMEHGDKIIWRDRKAERRRANEWEAIQKDIIEQYLEESKNEFNAEKNERIKSRKKHNNKISLKDVCKLQDACSIYELWEESNDPDSLTELLTEEQCRFLQNYQIQQKAEEQAEIAERLRKKLGEKNIKNRNVSSVLKLIVVDVNSLFHYRILNIWRPTETHLQELKEGQCVNFYNLSVKDVRNLSSTPRTCFTLNCNLDKTKFEKFERKVIPISDLKNKQLFDEFDTIGFVVEVNNEEDNKYMWIVDQNKMFLLIRIRSTFQGVSTFDGITPGKAVALQNLMHQKPTQNYAIAIANCYTTLFVQPRQLYLQYSMLEFIRSLPENKEEFFEECTKLVNTYKSENNLKLNELSESMIYDNLHKNQFANMAPAAVGFESDVLTVSDEEMSLIDTQYF